MMVFGGGCRCVVNTIKYSFSKDFKALVILKVDANLSLYVLVYVSFTVRKFFSE